MPDVNDLLRAALTAPTGTIPQVIATMEAIDAALPDADGLKWFNGLYLAVTKSVDQSVSGNEWERPEFIAKLDVVFAGLYFDALRGWLNPPAPAPNCWRVFFDCRNDVRLTRLQFALAGMNAHIDRDLAAATAETCRGLGFAPRLESPEHRDFTKVDDLLDSLIDQTKAELGAGLAGEAIPPLGKLEDLIAGAGLRGARQIAWGNAEVLFGLEAIPGLADRFLDALDRTATLAGRVILTPL